MTYRAVLLRYRPLPLLGIDERFDYETELLKAQAYSLAEVGF